MTVDKSVRAFTQKAKGPFGAHVSFSEWDGPTPHLISCSHRHQNANAAIAIMIRTAVPMIQRSVQWSSRNSSANSIDQPRAMITCNMIDIWRSVGMSLTLSSTKQPDVNRPPLKLP